MISDIEKLVKCYVHEFLGHPGLHHTHCGLLVFCVFHSNSSTMAAAGAIRRRHLPDGGIHWL